MNTENSVFLSPKLRLRTLDEAPSLSGKDRRHHAVRMQFLAGVADVLADRVDAYEESLGNVRRAETHGQELSTSVSREVRGNGKGSWVWSHPQGSHETCE